MYTTGDLLEIRSDLNKKQKKELLRREFPLLRDSIHGVRCIVLERVDSVHVFVAPCDISTAGKRIPRYLDYRIKQPNYILFVSTQVKYLVEESWFEISRIPPLAKPENLLDTINIGKEQFRRTKLLRNQIRYEKQKKLAQYQRKYDIAVMNNDRIAMQAIIDELGFAPIGRGHSKSRSNSYPCNNPKPYQGGRFSPK